MEVDTNGSNRFPIERLFEAVANGDVAKLDGLHQYLQKTMKNLSDTLCEFDTLNAPSPSP